MSTSKIAIAAENRLSRPFANLLVSLLLLILLYPLVMDLPWEPFMLDLFMSLVIIASVFAASRSATTRMFFFLLTIPVLVTRWIALLVPSEPIHLLGLAIDSAFLGLIAAKILLHVLRQRTVTSESILAALCVYLLFGLSWGLLYSLVDGLMPGAFRFPDAVSAGDTLQSLTYFSLVTLTTVGYGDITPQAPFAQALANIEAIIGQVYLAVLVARLVGIQVSQHMSPAMADRHDQPKHDG